MFNPHICESFYADEVLLVEGPTEEIIIRGILQNINSSKDLFVVNCGTVNNIPFYQKVYRKFAIKSHVICDTDSQLISGTDSFGNPIFTDGIQKNIYNEHIENCNNSPRVGGVLRVHDTTFEVAHQSGSINQAYIYPTTYIESHGKPLNANKYWCEVLEPNMNNVGIETVPIVAYLKEVLDFKW
jgi:hypothetical protein